MLLTHGQAELQIVHPHHEQRGIHIVDRLYRPAQAEHPVRSSYHASRCYGELPQETEGQEIEFFRRRVIQLHSFYRGLDRRAGGIKLQGDLADIEQIQPGDVDLLDGKLSGYTGLVSQECSGYSGGGESDSPGRKHGTGSGCAADRHPDDLC